MQRRTYYGGYYPYPPHYSYYPARTPPYQVPRKPLWPLALVLLGILLIAYGFISVPKLDPQIKRYAALYPERVIAAVVFCDPCVGIEGEILEEGKVMVIGEAAEIAEMANEPGVKQIRYVEKID